ncbi:MAG: hypothetical protein K1X47_01785 [Cyclobacteriaceae bacterium]|nr:hypothetical protein [Cyclobacteriaceae bacterium]
MISRVSNISVRSRVKQVILLIIIIVMGIMISKAAEAQLPPREKARLFEGKYKHQRSHASKECKILISKHHVAAVKGNKHHRAKRVKGMAEVGN